MKNTNNIKAVSVAVQAGVPVMLIGGPGIGKTSVIEQMAETLDLPIEVVIGSVREPSDFVGLPVVHNGQVKLAPPRWAENLVMEGKGVLLLDELSTSPPATQSAQLRVVLDRVVGDLKLPDAVAIIACSNPPETTSGAFELTAPMANRFVHLTWSHDHSEWCDGIVGGFQTPDIKSAKPGWKKNLHLSRALISSFIHARPSLLYQLPDNESEAGGPWASPRTWDMASKLHAAWETTGYSDDVLSILMAGTVGQTSAMEFLAYRDNLDLPNPEDLIKKPASLKLPERGDRVYAVLSSVTAAVLSNNTVDRWNAGWKVLGEAVTQGSADVAASAAKALVKNRPNGAGLPVEVTHFVPLLKGAGLM